MTNVLKRRLEILLWKLKFKQKIYLTPQCEIVNKWEKSIGTTTQMSKGNYSLIPSSNISPQVRIVLYLMRCKDG
jgi:hypothetical protein